MNVYKIIDMEGEESFYAATTPEEAIEAHNRDWDPKAATAELIPDDKLDTMKLVVMDEDESPTDETVTFREFMSDNKDATEAYQIGDIL